MRRAKTGQGADSVVPQELARRSFWGTALLAGTLASACGSAPAVPPAKAPSTDEAPTPAPAGEPRAAERPPAAGAPESGASAAPRSAAEGLRASLAPDLRGFCVHGGAPLVGRPLVDARGRLYLVTRDGYLHAYEPDGRFRFSFTVAGTPLGSPSLRASDGAVLLGTTARSVYGIGGEGTLSFQAHTLTPVWSGLHQRDARSVVYIGLDRFLYALSNYGVALYRVPIPGQPVGEPAVAPGGVVWIPLDTGLARMEQALSVQRFPTTGPVDQVGLGAKGPLIVTRGRLASFDARGVAVDHGAVETLLADGTSVLALDGAGGGFWLEGGDPAHIRPLGAYEAVRPSGEGGLAGDRALLPLGSGEVVLMEVSDPGRPVLVRKQILDEPLAEVAFAPGSRRLLVTSRAGRACLLDDPFVPARVPSGSR